MSNLTQHNRATLYSCGIAEFERVFSVSPGAGTTQSLRVRADELADALASFEVEGPVRYLAPPTWEGGDGDTALEVSPDAGLPGLLVQLVGAAVEVRHDGSATVGELVGLHEETRGGEHRSWQARYVVVLAGGVLERIALANVDGVKLLDPKLNEDLEHALRRRVERLRPSTRLLEFSLGVLEGAAEAATARVRYTLPCASWKVSYRLRVAEEGLTLAALAVVDNDTEEDWREVALTVVTGEPISFTTDLAEARRPRRERVSVVAEIAPGAAEILDAVPAAASAGAREVADGSPLGAHQSRRSRARKLAGSASFAPAARKEVGDLQVFEVTAPLSLRKGRSAAVPLFEIELPHSGAVLHYRHRTHAERPWRALELCNESDISLGRGVCAVSDGGVFAGNCVVPGIKPGETSLLAHALETGVRVVRHQHDAQYRDTGFVLSEGVLQSKTEVAHRDSYHLRNARDTAFTVLLDHDAAFSHGQAEAVVARGDVTATLDEAQRAGESWRWRFELRPHEEVRVDIVERDTTETVTRIIAGEQLDWFLDVFVVERGDSMGQLDLGPLVAARRAVQQAREELKSLSAARARLEDRQERLRKNLKSVQQQGATDKWRDELAKSEERLEAIDETELPACEAREGSAVDAARLLVESLEVST